MPIVFVDADACPVKEEIYRVTRRYDMHVAVVANAPLHVPTSALVELVICPGFGAADTRGWGRSVDRRSYGRVS